MMGLVVGVAYRHGAAAAVDGPHPGEEGGEEQRVSHHQGPQPHLQETHANLLAAPAEDTCKPEGHNKRHSYTFR